jgi:hypothetical protein
MADKMLELMARRPTQELVITLSDTVVEEYQAQGYTSVSRITTDEEIEWLREVYDLFFSGELELPKGALVNDVNRPLAEQRGQTVSQVLFPESLYPQLRETVYYRNSQRMARQLLGSDELTCWGHLARKAAGSMDHVAWHQDEAYWDPHFDHDAAAFWMPLDEATMESGAMSFVPGSHKGDLLRHGFPNDDPSVTALMLKEAVTLEQARPHPIPVGGVSVHHQRAIHGSGPNFTKKPRRAYVNVWNNKPVQRLEPHDRPWYWQKKEARDRYNNEKQYYHDGTFVDVTRQRKAGGG